MTIESSAHGEAVVLVLKGRMNAENAAEFEDVCQKWSGEGKTKVVADLTGLSYISSLGLRSVLASAQSLKAKGGSLALCGMQGLVRQVFEMTRLLDLFPVHATVEEALRAD